MGIDCPPTSLFDTSALWASDFVWVWDYRLQLRRAAPHRPLHLYGLSPPHLWYFLELFTLVAFMSLDLAAIAFGKAFGEFCSMAAIFLRVKPAETLCTDYLYSWSLVQQSEHNKERTWHRCEQLSAYEQYTA